MKTIAAAALAACNLTFNGKTAAVGVQAADVSAALDLPVTLPSGEDFAISTDNPSAAAGGFAPVDAV